MRPEGRSVKIEVIMRKSNSLFIAAVLIGAFSLPAHGGYFDRGPSDSDRDDGYKGRALKKAEEAFIEDDYEEVVRIGDSYPAKGSKINDELEYMEGRALLKLGRFDEARNCFTRVVNHSNRDELLDESYMGLADSYFLEGDYEKAKEHYDNVLRYFPDSDDKPIVYYRLGECCGKLGDKTESAGFNDMLVRLFPDSLEAKMLKGKGSSFVTYSVQVGSFTKWSNAKKLNDELKRQAFDVNIYTTVAGQSRFYRVRVGQYDKLSDAEDMARNLRNKGYPVKIYP